MAEKEKQDFLTYKGKPLVRNGDTIYYGNMSDDYVIMMRITSKKDFGGYDLASKVTVQLLSTDPDASAKERVIKTAKRKAFLRRWILPKSGSNARFAANLKT